jgi:hypothetical protein
VTLAARLVGILLAGSAFAEASDPAATRLMIEVRRAPGLEPEHFTLACDPPTGTVPSPARACRRIAALVKDAISGEVISSDWEALWLSGSRILCPPVYGGPEVMTVRGSFAGRPVDDRYTREDAVRGRPTTRWSGSSGCRGQLPPLKTPPACKRERVGAAWRS